MERLIHLPEDQVVAVKEDACNYKEISLKLLEVFCCCIARCWFITKLLESGDVEVKKLCSKFYLVHSIKFSHKVLLFACVCVFLIL